MENSKTILKRVDVLVKTDFVTAKFGNEWKKHAKENYDLDDIIEIAHTQGRRAILLEKEIKRMCGEL